MHADGPDFRSEELTGHFEREEFITIFEFCKVRKKFDLDLQNDLAFIECRMQ